MKRMITFFAGLFAILQVISSQLPLHYEENRTLTWQEAIEFYQDLEDHYENCRLLTAGETDSGKPLHLFIISRDTFSELHELKRSDKTLLLINNGIHPGEPCGVDASAKFAQEILQNPGEFSGILDSMIIAIIPVLNVGGALNRSPYNRANQNGPLDQGFRGNAINMDLNRDFIKLDTRNAVSFVRIIQELDPDVLIDTHTSNGADYPYVITLISTQRDKLNSPVSEFLYEEMIPELYSGMRNTEYEMIPYVMSMDRRNPLNGIAGFIDYPRYTTGYAALFNTIGFTVETHMFKDFRDRVLSTYHFLKVCTDYLYNHGSEVRKMRELAREFQRQKTEFVLEWKLDTSRYEETDFSGYEIKYRTSSVTGLETYYYDRNSLINSTIKNYSFYMPERTITAPEYYILPQAWKQVVDRMYINGVDMYPLKRDTQLMVEYYNIESFNTSSAPYNGHYYHSATKVKSVKGEMKFNAGDYFIPVKQDAIDFIVQALEPESVDSYFNWNFFDAILSRKEYFSPYVFDDVAKKILEDDPGLMEEFKQKKVVEEGFSNDHYAQLRFIYEHSPYSEKSYMRYPVARFNPGK